MLFDNGDLEHLQKTDDILFADYVNEETDYLIFYIKNENGWKATNGTDIWLKPGVVTEPTCTTGGYTTYAGMFTDETKTGDETPAKGHTYEGEPVWTWTKTEDGFAAAERAEKALLEKHGK